MTTLVRRCLICREEISAPWGPETYSETERLLREHLDGHRLGDFKAWVLGQQFGGTTGQVLIPHEVRP